MNTSSTTDNMQHLYPIQREVMLCAGEEKTPTHCPLTCNEFWPMDISSYAPVYRKLRVCMSLHSQGLFYGKKASKKSQYHPSILKTSTGMCCAPFTGLMTSLPTLLCPTVTQAPAKTSTVAITAY